ncbi:hypothetical protein PEC301889_20970 [Pectobacterium carotovorum subsp. carotovorum]|nr:hypothetical protein PEC301889_20970 [Pectobacterium carotovorum subsp. carotovorum]
MTKITTGVKTLLDRNSFRVERMTHIVEVMDAPASVTAIISTNYANHSILYAGGLTVNTGSHCIIFLL